MISAVALPEGLVQLYLIGHPTARSLYPEDHVHYSLPPPPVLACR